MVVAMVSNLALKGTAFSTDALASGMSIDAARIPHPIGHMPQNARQTAIATDERLSRVLRTHKNQKWLSRNAAALSEIPTTLFVA